MRKLILCGLLITATAAQAGVVVGGTRLIYPGDKKETSLTISNPDDINYLIQTSVDTSEGAKAPFLITPPLFRLNAKQDNVMRVIFTGTALPQDRESLYWLNVKSIPSTTPQKETNTLQIAIKTRIKLLYRPATISGKSEDAAGKLTWHRSGNQLIVDNPAPFYVNFQSISVNGKKLPKISYAIPKGETKFTIPAGVSGNTVTWKAINDYGSVGKEWKATF
ncbi:fimbrial biogenesis chaperone [Cronobacter dublinensis]|uniref:fimbrial biogenesis chaperone n=1 Tax=Cronobacter dublinensis TaxID=413497 RepID=UPI00039EABB1|nr:molecular chaperone [Cronobacter dublinensis]EKY3087503.1 molecular chaperone [Cronobacter dublinensis]ELY4004392.1 molecular chaperone [Cronobacter dublinensis]ELY4409735.1 molecular chaperone [Cronobacter dublinensis]ELY5818689.1 molecular chaperone [Cronobacter dublinensis]ELY6213167.1 molecular chaperone [Cronobacter dublinensis]